MNVLKLHGLHRLQTCDPRGGLPRRPRRFLRRTGGSATSVRARIARFNVRTDGSEEAPGVGGRCAVGAHPGPARTGILRAAVIVERAATRETERKSESEVKRFHASFQSPQGSATERDDQTNVHLTKRTVGAADKPIRDANGVRCVERVENVQGHLGVRGQVETVA